MQNIQTEYYDRAARFLNCISQTEQVCNSIIATRRGYTAEDREYHEDDLLETPLRRNLTLATEAAGDVLGLDHQTTVLLAGRARELAARRNHIAHGWLVGASLDGWWVDIRTGVYAEGYSDVRIQLAVLDAERDEASELVHHVGCLWTQLPGSGVPLQRIEDLE